MKIYACLARDIGEGFVWLKRSDLLLALTLIH